MATIQELAALDCIGWFVADQRLEEEEEVCVQIPHHAFHPLRNKSNLKMYSEWY